MKNENLVILSNEFEKNLKQHKLVDPFHKIKIEDIEISYRNFYSDPKNVDFERDICKEFDICDSESIKIFKKFLGE